MVDKVLTETRYIDRNGKMHDNYSDAMTVNQIAAVRKIVSENYDKPAPMSDKDAAEFIVSCWGLLYAAMRECALGY